MALIELRAAIPTSPPTLTIAIPTFQRLQWLRQSLAIVVDQVTQMPAGTVEVIVSENAGSDGSWAHLQTLASEHAWLHIHRNPTNIGGEANFRQLPKMSLGKYLWMLGDDDFLSPNALATVLDIASRDPDFIALNTLLCDADMALTGTPYWRLTGDVEVNSLDETLAIIPHFAMGFISCWIARRELFNVADAETYNRFKPWGLSLMLDRYITVSRSALGIITAKPMLRSRKPPPEEYSQNFDYFEWFFEGSAQLLELMMRSGLLSRKMVAQQKAAALRQTAVKRIIFERGSRILNRQRVAQILREHYRWQWRYWLLCLPALYFPGLGTLFRLVRPRNS